MSITPTAIDERDIRCSDLDLSDEAIAALARLLVDAAIKFQEQEAKS